MRLRSGRRTDRAGTPPTTRGGEVSEKRLLSLLVFYFVVVVGAVDVIGIGIGGGVAAGINATNSCLLTE